MTIRYLSLFSGIEAASVAWEPLGWEAMAYCEVAPAPGRVLAHRFPDVPNLGDVTAVDWEAWRTEHGSPDVMIAGSPCQAFSVAGQRRSLEDARGNLSLYTAELVRFLGPRVFIWENVPGVLNTDDNAFGCLLGELVGAGEPLSPPGGRWTDAGLVSGPERRAVWRIVDAQYLGVAQRRRRVFVVACPVDGADPAKILFEPEGVRRHSPPSRGTREGVAERIGLRAALEGLVGGGVRGDAVRGALSGQPTDGPRGFSAGSMASYDDSDTGGVVRAAGGDMGGGSETLVCQPYEVAHTLRGEGFDASEDGTGRGTPLVLAHGAANAEYRDDGCSTTLTCVHDGPPIMVAFTCKDSGQDAANDVAPTVRAMNAAGSTPNGGGQIAVLRAGGGFDALAVHDMATRCTGTDGSGHFNGKGHGLGIADEGDPMYTLTGGDRHAVPSPFGEVRRLTPTECARLQGFPDGWCEVLGADGPQYAGFGNSMAVPVIRWLGARAQAVLNDEPYTYGIGEAARDEIEGRNTVTQR